MSSSIGHLPVGAWKFDEGVTGVFGDMLARSIPQYAEMRSLCSRLLAPVVRGGLVVDVGCSDGRSIQACLPLEPGSVLGLDVSSPMLAAARERFHGDERVAIRELDVRDGIGSVVEDGAASAILCVLTLQFTPIEYRHAIVGSFAKALKPGGVLVLVEKVLGGSPWACREMVGAYHALKMEHGYSANEVETKRRSLEGVLVPLTAAWNEDLIARAGLADVECFWRWMNFGGWVARKC